MNKFIVSLLTAAALMLNTAHAADIYLSLSSHGTRMVMGIGEFTPETPTVDESKLGRDIRDVLRYDLLFSRYFNIQEGGPGYTGLDTELVMWQEQGVTTLVCGKVKIKDRQLKLTAQIVDIGSKQVIWEKALQDSIDNYRSLAHELNDQVVLHFTGERGIATTKIAFVNNKSGHKELYLADYDGYNIKQLTSDNSIALLPCWAPDGKEILYTTYRFGNPDLYAISPEDGNLRPVSQRQGLNTAGSFSPDGTKIALTLSQGKAPSLYLIKRSGEVLQKLTFGNDIGTSPSFAPNGQEIVYLSDNPGYPQLFIMSFAGGNVRRLPARGYCDSPAWSPRGDKIVFTMRQGKEDTTYDLYMYDLASMRITRVTQNEGNNENPSWSRDGRFIVFSSTRSGKSEIYITAIDGSGTRRLTAMGGSSFMPDWSQ